jgi:hypothetical protein
MCRLADAWRRPLAHHVNMDVETAKDAMRMALEDVTLKEVVTETPHRQGAVPLGICGEPVVGRALALLLQSPRYNTRFVSVSSSGEVASLEGIRLVLLAPTPGLSVERREALLATLGDATAVADIPMLELTAFPEQAERRHAQMLWPCSAEQLERCISAVLLAKPCEGDRREGSRPVSPGEQLSA